MFHLNTVVVDSNSENKELEEQFLSNRSRTQILINSASIIDEADDQILPAIYLPLQQRLGFSLVQLGAITAVGSLLQSVSTPIWGWLSDTQSRKTILSLGCFLWGLFTFLLGTSDTYVNMLFFRAMTGIGLAVIIPTAQSLITDYFFEEERGIANALVISTVIPWLICLFIYFFVYSSYPRDRDKIKNIIKERSNLLKNGILH